MDEPFGTFTTNVFCIVCPEASTPIAMNEFRPPTEIWAVTCADEVDEFFAERAVESWVGPDGFTCASTEKPGQRCGAAGESRVKTIELETNALVAPSASTSKSGVNSVRHETRWVSPLREELSSTIISAVARHSVHHGGRRIVGGSDGSEGIDGSFTVDDSGSARARGR